MKDTISLFTHTETFNVYIIYIQVVLKRIHKCVPKARNMRILFNEQAVCKRGTRLDNGLLDINGQ